MAAGEHPDAEVRRIAYGVMTRGAVNVDRQDALSSSTGIPVVPDEDVRTEAESRVSELIKRLRSMIDRAPELRLSQRDIEALEEAVGLLLHLTGSLGEVHDTQADASVARRRVATTYFRVSREVGKALLGVALFAAASTTAADNLGLIRGDLIAADEAHGELQECLDSEFSDFGGTVDIA